MMDETREVSIYIDTSIKGPKRGDGSYLYLMATQLCGKTADVWKWVELEDTTENQLAVHALAEALGRLTKSCRLTIWTECPYLAMILKGETYKQWREQNWMTSKAKPVCDAEKWQEIERLLTAHEIWEVRLKEHNAYRGWMRTEIKKREKNAVLHRCNRKE